MTDKQDWVPNEVDEGTPSSARIYDYLLGGGHNFDADRQIAERFNKALPGSRDIARLNRAFLRRAVMFMADQGIRQFLDNVTTIMLVAPVTIVVCNRPGRRAQPYLVAEVLASNIGGVATLIGDPPNIIIGSRAGLTFNDFLVHMVPAVVAIFVVFVVSTRVLFAKSFQYNPDRVAQVMALQERRAITDPRLLIRCMIVLAGVVAGFGLHSVLHVAPSIVALVGAGVMYLVARVDGSDVLREVEWSTLAFFAGLFMMVAGLVHTGVIATIGTWAVEAFGDNYFLAATTLLFGSGVLGAFFDNIPYVADHGAHRGRRGGAST